MFILFLKLKGGKKMNKLISRTLFDIWPFSNNLFNEGQYDYSWPFYDDSFEKEEIVDTEDGKRIFINVPGRNKDNIEIELTDNILKVSGKSIENENRKLSKIHCFKEFSYSWNVKDFSDDIKATIKDGILTIDLKYKEKPKKLVKKIEIT